MRDRYTRTDVTHAFERLTANLRDAGIDTSAAAMQITSRSPWHPVHRHHLGRLPGVCRVRPAFPSSRLTANVTQSRERIRDENDQPG